MGGIEILEGKRGNPKPKMPLSDAFATDYFLPKYA
jgi:hypothetical protein